ncbi:Cytochrome c subfamily, putative [Verrucomicrobiia bacterium DG1235]|nr:Cytochrome c subfamily, putative [Verrucomicrobiae bacterium DG1235]
MPFQKYLFPSLLLTLAASAFAERAFDPQRYLGHLELGRSTFVVTEEVSGLDVPWDVEAAADGSIWFTQHAGSVSRLDPDTGEVIVTLESIPDLYNKKSLGLFGMALHPNFKDKPYVFLHYSYRLLAEDLSEIIKTRLVRYKFDGQRLGHPVTIFDEIPGKAYHNGSRIVITQDEKLYLTTGDTGDTMGSLDPDKLTGKVLRMNLDGSVPKDNPTPGSYVWSLGHRNAQGLVLASNGKLYASEHGPNNDDEVNLIQANSNYGWPIIEGFIDQEREIENSKNQETVEPLTAWTPTLGASGLAYYENPSAPEWHNSLLLVALKGQVLRSLKLDESGEKIESERIYFQKRFGRIRDITVAANGDIFFTTSNRDWHPRYQPWMYDGLPEDPDRIIRLHLADTRLLDTLANLEHPIAIKEDPEPLPLLSENWSFPVSDEEMEQGQSLYMTHCAACHNPLGTGSPDLFPPLTNTDWVAGDKSRLIQTVLTGLSGPIIVNGEKYDQEMPGFANLADQDLAAILSYIRRSFGNNANGVIPGEIYEERKGLKK